ncbi:MAG TPA: RES family NAD+ phosphorylase [Thermoanaerobaculia bacterium]|nr:RES family NAD+ phosphorylase [Thermoanaerobaculia bacterium]
MAKFPEPPAQLAAIPPKIRTLPSGTLLWRVYFRGGKHPTLWNGFRAFGPTPGGRFDHHLPPPAGAQRRQILYAARHGSTCLAEVFQDTRVIDRSARDPWLVGFVLGSAVTLLDLTGSWPTRAGASMAMSSGARPRAQRWSRAIYETYPALQGLRYPASMHGNRPAVALYERAAPALPPSPAFHRPLLDPALLPILRHVAHDLGYGLV